MPTDEDAISPVTERRFNEAEVAAIFAQASEAQDQTHGRQLPSGEGLTLTELREIGREVGISSEQIGKAAQLIARGGAATRRTFLGLPIGVRQTVDLDRKLSDVEWERLVVDLRETFDARVMVRKDGSIRSGSGGTRRRSSAGCIRRGGNAVPGTVCDDGRRHVRRWSVSASELGAGTTAADERCCGAPRGKNPAVARAAESPAA